MSGARQPNVVLIVLDDLGFADFGCYGSDIATPNIDRLAAQGLRYNRFHVTPLCAPTRACLLTGRNHHNVGMGTLPEFPVDGAGYTTRIPRSAGTLARVLRDAGYSTFATGKWHLTPREDMNPAGPFDRWPLGLGFERYYGFLWGMTDQYVPYLVSDNAHVDPPHEEGYHLSSDLAARAIRMVQDQQQATPDKPFFLYFATGAVHTPHQVPANWIEPYRGRFDHGWDAERESRFARQLQTGLIPPRTMLTPRSQWVPAWNDLSGEERRVFARQMETYAGFLTHTDAQIGRVVDYLASIEALDDTIVMVVSDNGAEGGHANGMFNQYRDAGDLAEMVRRIDDFGGVDSSPAYARGWAWAGNTPLRLWKAFTWLGGVRVPFIVRWTAGIRPEASGQIRSQFSHAIDVMPTVLEAANVPLPAAIDGVTQKPLDGRSLLTTFHDASTPGPRDTQYFEMFGSRSIYSGGWKATNEDSLWRATLGGDDAAPGRWSLFNLETDFSEAHDLAAAEPERLQRMIELWWHEAGRNQAAPPASVSAMSGLNDELQRGRPDRTVYDGGSGPIETPAPLRDGFTFTADVEVSDQGEAAGVIGAQRLRVSGFLSHAVWTCYLVDGRLVVAFDGSRICEEKLAVPARFEVSVAYMPISNGRGTARVRIDGREVASAEVEIAVAPAYTESTGVLVVGRDWSACQDYRPPFRFRGTIRRAEFRSGA